MGEMKATCIHYELEPMEAEYQSIVSSIKRRVSALCVDMADRAIVNAAIRAAREEGFTDLHLLDRDFVMDALRKASPVKPKLFAIGEHAERYRCGCGRIFANDDNFSFCPRCGQRIMWYEEENE